jgi:hypothetical protein
MLESSQPVRVGPCSPTAAMRVENKAATHPCKNCGFVDADFNDNPLSHPVLGKLRLGHSASYDLTTCKEFSLKCIMSRLNKQGKGEIRFSSLTHKEYNILEIVRIR